MQAPDAGRGYVVHAGCDHIFFIGFLGAGKSTLARNLGKMFGRDYLDVDRYVERLMHKSVTQIFEQEGEQSFRQGECHALKQLKSRKSLLVSCGGGIVETPEACALMHEMGVVVYLDGDLDDSMRQIRHVESRPDLGSPEHARALYEHRRPLYEREADIVIDIRGKTFEQVAADAGSILWERGLL